MGIHDFVVFNKTDIKFTNNVNGFLNSEVIYTLVCISDKGPALCREQVKQIEIDQQAMRSYPVHV